MQQDTDRHLGIASEQTQLKKLLAVAAPTQVTHRPKGISEALSDLQSLLELCGLPCSSSETSVNAHGSVQWCTLSPKAHPVPPSRGMWSFSLEPSRNTRAVNLRLGPWILMGLVLMREWEQFWQTQSFPLNVTLSPIGKGFLWSRRGGEV